MDEKDGFCSTVIYPFYEYILAKKMETFVYVTIIMKPKMNINLNFAY